MKNIYNFTILIMVLSNPSFAQYLYKDLVDTVPFVSAELEVQNDDEMYFTQPIQPSVAPEEISFVYNGTPKQLPCEQLLYEKILNVMSPSKDERKRVRETTVWPHRFYGQLSLYFKEGEYQGSGVLVGPQHMLTSAHNVYNLKTNEFIKGVKARFALNKDQAPYGEVAGVRVYIDQRYIHSGDRQYDFALIVLDKPVGYKIGSVGLMSLPDNKIIGQKISITGYPSDKGGKQMWTTQSKVKSVDSNSITCLENMPGQNGSFICVEKLGNPYLVGILTLGDGPFSAGNTGIRMSQNKLRMIYEKWIAETNQFKNAIVAPIQPLAPSPKEDSSDSSHDKDSGIIPISGSAISQTSSPGIFSGQTSLPPQSLDSITPEAPSMPPEPILPQRSGGVPVLYAQIASDKHASASPEPIMSEPAKPRRLELHKVSKEVSIKK